MDSVKELRVWLDSSLSLDKQISAVVRMMFFYLCQACQLPPYLSHSSLTVVIHIMAISHLDYYNVLYMGLPLRAFWKL